MSPYDGRPDGTRAGTRYFLALHPAADFAVAAEAHGAAGRAPGAWPHVLCLLEIEQAAGVPGTWIEVLRRRGVTSRI